MDPNKTILSGVPFADPNKTVLGAPPIGDPMRTTAMAPLPQAETLTVSIERSRDATLANGPAREAFLLEIQATGSPDPSFGVGVGRTPLNLCLVLDRSGSMEGQPLEYAKQACAYVVDLLSPNDVLSIVTFEETVDVLMPPQRVTNKEMIKAGLQRLMPGNTTNLYDGLALGMQQVLQLGESGRSIRMVVLSDGDPTSGIKDFSSLVSFAGDIKNRGITCTFLGFGPDYNEELLASMAKRAGGNYYYIPNPQMLPEVFRTELEKAMSVVAQNLKLSLRLSRWVTMKGGQFKQENDREFSLNLADLERGSLLQQVVDLEFPNHPLGHYRVAGGKLTYDDCLEGKTKTVDIDLSLEFTADRAKYSAPVNPKVRQAVDLQAASRVVEKTIMGLKTGQVTVMGAMQELQKTQMLLTSQGRTSEAQEVTLALRALQSGDASGAEKTLMGTMVQLDQGKSST